MLQVVDAVSEHVEQFLAKPTRQDDIDEWFAATGGHSVSETLRQALTFSPEEFARALLNDSGECICLWGLAEGPYNSGTVWLVASEEAEQHAKHIHRFWPREVALMHMRYDLLAALAYEGNELHLSWLQAIGFEPVAVDLIGPSKLAFITHVRNMPSCAIQ